MSRSSRWKSSRRVGVQLCLLIHAKWQSPTDSPAHGRPATASWSLCTGDDDRRVRVFRWHAAGPSPILAPNKDANGRHAAISRPVRKVRMDALHGPTGRSHGDASAAVGPMLDGLACPCKLPTVRCKLGLDAVTLPHAPVARRRRVQIAPCSTPLTEAAHGQDSASPVRGASSPHRDDAPREAGRTRPSGLRACLPGGGGCRLGSRPLGTAPCRDG